VTEILLRELSEAPPPGEWVLWGRPDELERFRFSGAIAQRSSSDPRRLFGQAEAVHVPRGDVVVYMHQIRPFRPGRSVTFILDTIPLRHGGSRLARLAKRAFFQGAAALSHRIVTISEFSKASIVRDLRVRDDTVAVVSLPVDTGRAHAVAQLRAQRPRQDVLLYVGRFDRHKNLERLCRAFAASRFAERGGKLLLVGGWAGETEAMDAWVRASGLPSIEVRPQCSEEELDVFMATSRALILPSLEEGYGLPAFEAAASGLPVAVSRAGAMEELTSDEAVFFDPLDVVDMTAAIDEATERRPRPPITARRAGLRHVVLDSIAHVLTRR
jgi:glycosyltransferase involved in cell wall biosynthesis